MKIAVTGAEGFIGAAICTELIIQGHIVVPITRKSRNSAEIAVGDIGPDTNWFPLLNGVDCIVHCAARAHILKETSNDPLSEFRKTNSLATKRLAEQAANCDVPRFIFLSSVGVLGTHTNQRQPFSTSDIECPSENYGKSKWEAENYLWEISKRTGMEVVIIRPPLVYGPGVKGNFASLVKWVRTGIPLPLDNINNMRSFLALDNIVNFLSLCVDKQRSPLAANQLFLISDNEDISTSELIHKVAAAYNTKTRLISISPTWLHLAAQLTGKITVFDRLFNSLQVDSSKAQTLLNWTPVVSMDEQLKRMAQHDTRS